MVESFHAIDRRLLSSKFRTLFLCWPVEGYFFTSELFKFSSNYSTIVVGNLLMLN